jgi:hypothetical protein
MSYSTDERLKRAIAGQVNLTQQVEWWIRSDQNPLWNYEGKSTLRPGGGPPQELVLKIEDMRSELGEPPEDLGWGYLQCKNSA